MKGKVKCKRRVGKREKSWLRNIRESTNIVSVEIFFLARPRQVRSADGQPPVEKKKKRSRRRLVLVKMGNNSFLDPVILRNFLAVSIAILRKKATGEIELIRGHTVLAPC
ncbi:jg13737 [Pararge aegeria aegeria]|uniref:Jg13737 protein n=1 Tax=Pararge aegeria aegeria TaxID=348720 RepID=A0A8S4RQU1_9NEOP|nr:jg13737 [Pararge aegeria aegeria]